jgi:gliding motility-associated-like protein
MNRLTRNIIDNCFIKVFLVIQFLVFSNVFYAQLTVSKKYTPGGIVSQVLKGKGVEISNVKYTGASNALGTFKAVGTNLGISEGIILSSGSIYNAIGPNSDEDKSTDFKNPGYTLLGSGSLDAAILEFDFTPQGDTLVFQYVFASEEYPEYVNQEFNDVFGFFISGPGISGVKNIALLPDGNNVAINNVNHLKNSNYYISNDKGNTIQYDGFTTVLTAKAIVKCGKTYHLILAIADVQDRVYDSAIFLSAKSLSVPAKYEAKATLSNYFFEEDSSKMNENCTSAKINLSRAGNLINSTSTVDISLSGSAVVGKDISNSIPKQITFNKGELTKTIDFDALYDKELDSLDSLILTFNSVDFCEPITMKFYIANVEPLSVLLPDDSVYCKGKPIVLKPVVKGGLGNYNYTWSTGSFSDSIIVLPIVTTNYTVTVTDKCYTVPITVSNKVTIPIYKPISVNKIPDIVEICPYKPTYINLIPQFGGGGYAYEWYIDGKLFSYEKNDTIKPSQTSDYKVLIRDRCGDTISTQFKYTILSPPLITSMLGDSLMCYGDSTLLRVKAEGGYGKYSYRWLLSSSTSDSSYATGLKSRFYNVFVSDECKTFEIEDSLFVRILRPIVNFEIQGDPLIDKPLTLINKSIAATKFAWFVDRNFVSNKENIVVEVPDSANHAFKLIVTDDFGCTNDTTIYRVIFYPPSVYVPNAFTPNGNLYNNIFYPVLTSIKAMDFRIYNRWGELVFNTNDLNKSYWDGTYNGQMCPNDVYIYKLKTVSVTGEKKEFIGHVSLIR